MTKRNKRDHLFRWRRRFALIPRRIGDRWIWLRRYAWRYLNTVNEATPFYMRPFFYYWNEEWALPCGYRMRCSVSAGVSLGTLPWTFRDWYPVPANGEDKRLKARCSFLDVGG